MNNIIHIVNNVIWTQSHTDASGRIFLPDNDDTINYCTNNVASVFLLAGIGPHLGADALGYSQTYFCLTLFCTFYPDRIFRIFCVPFR